jgi:DNA excision repair protein ERCC-4
MADLYLRKAFDELHKGKTSEEGSGLLVMARGLGLRRVLIKFIQEYGSGRTSNSGTSPVFLIGLKEDEAKVVVDCLAAEGVSLSLLPKIITFDTPTAERIDRYQQGGVFIATSRILIVDLLNHNVRPERIFGMLVANAHRVSPDSIEAFILRVYREGNQTGFIRAFTEEPELLVGGEFNKLDRIMKTLWCKRLSIWPRNRQEVDSTFEVHPVVSTELTTTLSKNMRL